VYRAYTQALAAATARAPLGAPSGRRLSTDNIELLLTRKGATALRLNDSLGRSTGSSCRNTRGDPGDVSALTGYASLHLREVFSNGGGES